MYICESRRSWDRWHRYKRQGETPYAIRERRSFEKCLSPSWAEMHCLSRRDFSHETAPLKHAAKRYGGINTFSRDARFLVEQHLVECRGGRVGVILEPEMSVLKPYSLHSRGYVAEYRYWHLCTRLPDNPKSRAPWEFFRVQNLASLLETVLFNIILLNIFFLHHMQNSALFVSCMYKISQSNL